MQLVKIEDEFKENGLIFTRLKNIFFHPQGGGQPDDRLTDIAGNEIQIKKIEDKLYLGVNPDVIEEGGVKVLVDKDFNQLCSRLHSAGHLIALVVNNQFNTPPVKANHFPDEAYIKVEGIIGKENLDRLHKILDDECSLDRNVAISEDHNGRFVNFTGLGGYYCGGTHVKSLSEIGTVQINSISNKKGNTTIKYSVSL